MRVLGENPPLGEYRFILNEIRLLKEKGDIASRFEWIFEVVDGEHAGCSVSRYSGSHLKKGENYLTLLEELYGREIKRGEDLDPVRDLLLKEFTGVVYTTLNGGVNVQFKK